MSKTTKKYTVTLEPVEGMFINGKKFDSVYEALSLYKPQTVKGRVNLTVESDGKTWSRMLFVPIARKIFSLNDFTRQIYARNIERALS